MISMKIVMIGVVYTGTLHGQSATVYIYRNDVGLINHVFVMPSNGHNQRLSPMNRLASDSDILGTLGADEVGIFTPVSWETNTYNLDY